MLRIGQTAAQAADIVMMWMVRLAWVALISLAGYLPLVMRGDAD